MSWKIESHVVILHIGCILSIITPGPFVSNKPRYQGHPRKLPKASLMKDVNISPSPRNFYVILIKRKPSRLLRRFGELRLRDAQRQYQFSLPQSPPRSALANPVEGPEGSFEGL